MLQVESRISQRLVTSKGKRYAQHYIYLPKDLVKDSTFPFKSEDRVLLRIEEGHLVVKKIDE